MKTLQERFEDKVIPDPNSGCWLWTASITSAGHGQFSLNGATVGAHRASYEFHIGQIPEGMWVLHKCDVPSCVNPDHLFLGTHQDNMDDMNVKGRSTHGTKHWAVKLTEGKVLEIRDDRRSCRVIARDYGISHSLVNKIKNYELWTRLA